MTVNKLASMRCKGEGIAETTMTSYRISELLERVPDFIEKGNTSFIISTNNHNYSPTY